ncbi:hypothetical protein FC75_GL000074 [Lacticaseibacillus camelliae DSM 22697 = JCM 13995]|uniref:Zn-dependent peptidase n=2 Tax=Lacticaseibacillus camelliae TaxID=381742 RepID=A0A0R2EYL8_9LACO|nr:pitrilysin family protein [Lacticaseibacillus camelliae]KRN20742.1 hypothetical protein FC75_GL000074 [Lacticaseibacillus camelliae DSM 22697 = JCM 13995]
METAMAKKYYPTVGETLVTKTLANGLRVLLVPKPAYHQTYAMFAVNYGGIDVRYQPAGVSEMVEDPEGIAHFLEHKLFEKEDHDAFDLFGQTGASANAFTGATSTAYLFSTSTKLSQNLKTLLDFVQMPYFSDKTVAKERGIIGQEIQMYQDDPGWLLYYGIIGNLYPGHPVARDVTGTIDSIAKITPERLYQAYRTFYQPSNMTLTLVGSFNAAAIMAQIADDQAQKTFAPSTPIVRGVGFDGDLATILPYRAADLPVIRPKSAIGIKGQVDVQADLEGTKYKLAIEVLLEMVFGDSSPLYQQWYDEGLVDDSFAADYIAGRTFNYATISGDADDPSAMSDAVAAVIARGADQPALTAERFERILQAALGKYYMSLNSLEQTANQLSSQSFTGLNAFEVVDALKSLTLEDVKAAAVSFFDVDAVSVFHVRPEAKA